MNRFQCYIAGEQEPFLMGSEKSLARVMRALLETGSRLRGSHFIADKLDGRSDFIISVDIPDGRVEKFKEIAKCTLERHAHLQVGMDEIKSVKYYDEPEMKISTKEFNEKESALGGGCSHRSRD